MDLELTDPEFECLRVMVKERAGIHLSDSKRQLVKSRLHKRLTMLGFSSFRDYHAMLEAEGPSGPESVEFINRITTNKTDFFREVHHFNYVRDNLVPELIRKATLSGQRRLRIWHAGCSTGEEPYTMAMVLQEALGHLNWDIKLLATDIDTNVLAHAKQAVYDIDRIDPVPKELRQKYFQKGVGEREGFVKVRRDLQDLISFRQLNLLDDPWPIRPETRFDMIFCRNVVIYFDKPTQQRLFDRFSKQMIDGGHLFVGHSENLLGVCNLFKSIGGTIHRLDNAAKKAA